MKSLEQFTDDYVPMVHRKFGDIGIVSIDTENDHDGRSFADVVSYFSNMGADHIKFNVHGNDKAKAAKQYEVIK